MHLCHRTRAPPHLQRWKLEYSPLFINHISSKLRYIAIESPSYTRDAGDIVAHEERARSIASSSVVRRPQYQPHVADSPK